jgi:hypothetical protein
VNLVEFDYFPAFVDPDFGPSPETVSPTIISKNDNFAYSFNALVMTNTHLYYVQMTYTATNQTLVTLMTDVTAGITNYGPVADVVITDFSSFSDFRVDTFSISSYSHTEGDGSSLLAHGVVDNLSITVPPPPVANVSLAFAAGTWQAHFNSQSNWVYTMERTFDFQNWAAVSATAPGTGAGMSLSDTNAPGAKSFYRVRATIP